MPYLLNLKTDRQQQVYLNSLFQEVYIKDIVERNGIERQDVLEGMLDFLGSSVSSLTNPTNITNSLNSMRHTSISSNTVSAYLGYMKEAFPINEAKRYDIKGKSYFGYPNKYYFPDVGLRNARLSFRQIDPGHMMENLVYIELLRRGYAVDVGVVTDRRNGQNKQKEIDFVVNSGNGRMYSDAGIMWWWRWSSYVWRQRVSCGDCGNVEYFYSADLSCHDQGCTGCTDQSEGTGFHYPDQREGRSDGGCRTGALRDRQCDLSGPGAPVAGFSEYGPGCL